MTGLGGVGVMIKEAENVTHKETYSEGEGEQQPLRELMRRHAV